MLAMAALAAAPSGAGAAVSVTNVTTVPGLIDDATSTAVVYRPANTPPGDEFGDPHYEPLTLRPVGGSDVNVPIPAGRQMNGADARVFGNGVLFVTYSSNFNLNGELDEWHPGDVAATSLGSITGVADLHVAGNYAVWSSDSTTIKRRDTSHNTVTITADGIDPSVADTGDVVYTDRGTPRNIHRWQAGVDSQVSNTPNGQQSVSAVTDGTNVVYAQVPPCCNTAGGSIFVGGSALSDTATPNGDISRNVNYAVRGGWTGFTRTSRTEVWSRSPVGALANVGNDGAPDGYLFVDDVSPGGQVAYGRGSLTFLGAAGQRPFPFGTNDYTIFWDNNHWYVIRGDKLDRVDTDTVITAKPTGPTTATTAHFELASTAAHDPSFTCTLDGNAVDCSSGAYDASSLSDGSHTFTATSHDPDLNVDDATPASVTWTVDTTPPSAFNLTNPSEGDFRRPSETNFAWTAATDTGGSGIVSYEFYIDDKKVRTLPASETSVDDAEEAGPHTWKVRAIDAAGNHRDESGSFTIDGTAPTIPPLTAPADRAVLTDPTPTLQWGAASDDSGVAGYRVYIDGERVASLGPAARSYTPPAPLDDGEHSWGIGAVDAAGNLNGETRHFTIDTSPPSQPGPPGISINDGDQFTNDPDVTLTARWPHGVRNMLISNDGGFGGASATPVTFHVPWHLDSSGPERLPKTVYVRYLGGGAGNETYTDDIILDETSPSLLMARFAPAGGKHLYAIKLRARDEVSGVHKVQVAHRKRHPGRVLEYRRTLKVRATARPRFARVRDRAGNWSHWRKIAAAH